MGWLPSYVIPLYQGNLICSDTCSPIEGGPSKSGQGIIANKLILIVFLNSNSVLLFFAVL